MDTFTECVTLVQSESEGLMNYLRVLPTDAWDHPSACDRWLVRDVVAHLGGSGAFYAESVARGLRGEHVPFGGRPPAGSVKGADFAERIAQRVLETRERLGDGVLTAYEESSNQFNDLVAALTPAAAEALCYHPAKLLSVQTFVGLRLLELVIHGWDIRSPLEGEVSLSPESATALVEFWPEFVEWGFQPGAGFVAPTRYRFVFGGSRSQPYDIVVEANTVRMEPAETTQADVTFRCVAETFVLLMCGRRSLEVLLARGHMTVDRDHAKVVEVFSQWFPGV